MFGTLYVPQKEREKLTFGFADHPDAHTFKGEVVTPFVEAAGHLKPLWPKTSWPKTSWPKTSWPKTSWPKTSWPKTSWPKTSWPKTSWPKTSPDGVSVAERK
jgi:hypothetical protein